MLRTALILSLLGHVRATSDGFLLATQDSPVNNALEELVAEEYMGIHLGQLSDPQNIGVSGDVYVVNDTCIQILGFNYGSQAPDLYFWADRSRDLTSSGVRLSSFEFGDMALGSFEDARVVVLLPDHVKVSDLGSFGVWCQAFAKNFGSVRVPEGMKPPKAAFLQGVIMPTKSGKRYGVSSGPVLAMDSSTLKVYGFMFKGFGAPNATFFVGRGDRPRHDSGVKVPIRGTYFINHDSVPPVKEDFKGQDVILELPEGYDVHSIDWLSLYCHQFRLDFGHIDVAGVPESLPPPVPLQSPPQAPPPLQAWPELSLLGKESRRNFTFHLGPPGGARGFQALTRSKPSDFVWYVNGLMTPTLWLKRGLTYQFNVEGGNETGGIRNPLFFSSDPFGGYEKLSLEEQIQIRTYAGVEEDGKGRAAGRLCFWAPMGEPSDPDAYEDFMAYRETLRLSCQPGKAAVFSFTPDSATPDLIYYQSFTSYNMGWKMMIVDEIPPGIPDTVPEPFSTAIWLDSNMITEVPNFPSLYSSSSSLSIMSIFFLSLSLAASQSLR